MKYALFVFILALSIGCQTMKSKNQIKEKEIGQQAAAQSASRSLSSILNERLTGNVTALNCKCTYYYDKRRSHTRTVTVSGDENLIIAELVTECLKPVLPNDPGFPMPGDLEVSAHSCGKMTVPFHFNYGGDPLVY